MLGLSILSVALMVVDHLSDFLDEARAGLSILVTPVVVIADYPNRTVLVFKEVFSSREQMQAQIVELDQELLLLKVKTLEMAALRAENNRLRDLLGSAASGAAPRPECPAPSWCSEALRWLVARATTLRRIGARQAGLWLRTTASCASAPPTAPRARWRRPDGLTVGVGSLWGQSPAIASNPRDPTLWNSA